MVIKGLVLAVAIACTIIIGVNLALRADEPRLVVERVVFKPVVVSPDDPTTLPWEDNFDSSFIEPKTGCLYLTHKRK